MQSGFPVSALPEDASGKALTGKPLCIFLLNRPLVQHPGEQAPASDWCQPQKGAAGQPTAAEPECDAPGDDVQSAGGAEQTVETSDGNVDPMTRGGEPLDAQTSPHAAKRMDEGNEQGEEGGGAESEKWSLVCAHNKLKFQCKECCSPVLGDGKYEPIVIDSDEEMSEDAGLGEEAGGTAAERPVVSATQVPELEFSVIFPRRKTVNANGKGDDGEPVFVTREFITPYFKMPMVAACAELGVCPTSMKKACRKLGIVKWPYRQTVAALRHTKAASSPTAGVAIDAQGGAGQPGGQQQEMLQGAELPPQLPGSPSTPRAGLSTLQHLLLLAGQPGGQQQEMLQGAELMQAQILQQLQSQQQQEHLQRQRLKQLQVLVRGSMAPAPKRALPLPPPLSPSQAPADAADAAAAIHTQYTNTHTDAAAAANAAPANEPAAAAAPPRP